MTTPAVALTECLQCIFSQVGRPFCGVEKCKFSQTRPATAKAKVNSPQTLLPEPPLLFSRIESSHNQRSRRRQGCQKQAAYGFMLPRTRGRPTGRMRGGSGHVLRRRLLLPHLRESRLVAGIFDALLVLLPRAAVRGGGRRKEGGARINTPPAIPMNKCSLVISKQNKELNSPTTRSPAFLRAPPATISLGNHHALVLPTMIMCVVVCPARTGRGAARCSDGQSAARLSSVSSRR